MKRFLLYNILFFLLNTVNFNTFGQEVNGYLELKGTIQLEREGISGAKIEVYDGNKYVTMHTCDNNGKFKFELQLNKEYTLVVKKEGFFSKKLYVNTEVPKQDEGAWSYRFSMELLSFVEGFNAAVLDMPIGKIKFVDDYGDFDYDEEYTRAMQKKLSEMMSEYEKMKKEQYKKLIAKADDDFNNGDYPNAIKYYEQAAKLDPYNPYPDDQLSVIKKLQAKDRDKQKSYDKAIAEADELFKKKDYKTAKMHYNRALRYFNKPYPNEQIKFIDDYFANIAKTEADAAAKEEAYKDLIATGDRMLRNKEYETAIQKYQAALGVKPNEAYPKTKIQEVQDLLAQMQQDAKNRENLERQYQKNIAQADASFNQKQYEQALNHYEQASKLKPDEVYPKTKIAEIDNLLAANRSKEESYQNFIAIADKAAGQKFYDKAKSNYRKALNIKPNEAYPKNKIAEIDALLLAMKNKKKQELEQQYQKNITQADAAFEQKNYVSAKNFYEQAQQLKPTEEYPKNKINEIAQLLVKQAQIKQAYDKALAQADNDFNAQRWEEAKVNYQKALELLPHEQHPQTRLQEIENKLLAMKNAKEQRAAREKSYKEALAKADTYFKEQKYAEAKNYYTQASGIKPDEKYPKDKLIELENLMANLAQQQQQYNQKIQEAGNLFAQKNYNAALGIYKEAMTIKPNEPLPKQKIKEIETILSKLAKNEQLYTRFLKQGDQLFANTNYTEAQNNYNKALEIKPNEQYPKEQLAKISQLINDKKRLEAQLKQQMASYKQKIATADKLFSNKEYDKAISLYLDAKNIKSDEKYPDEQIMKINQLIQAEQEQLEKQYKQALASGDAFVNNKNYEEAQKSYEKALQIKPNDDVAQAKITELKNLIAQNKANQQQLASINAKYQKLIKNADSFFSKNDFVSALAMYKNALRVKPNEKYPQQRIATCENKIKQQKVLADAAARKASDAAAAKAAKSFDEKEDFDYKGEKRDRTFLNDLAKKYPEGITVENYSRPNKKIKRVIVNKNGIAKEYVEVTYSYGTFYFRNGQNISRAIFYSETND